MQDFLNQQNHNHHDKEDIIIDFKNLKLNN